MSKKRKTDILLCYVCQDFTDHKTENCSKVVCKLCGIKGHVNKNCPFTQKSIGQEEKIQCERSNSPHGSVEEGEIVDDLPKFHRHTSKKICPQCFQYNFHSTQKKIHLKDIKEGATVAVFLYLDLSSEEFYYLKSQKPWVKFYQIVPHEYLQLETRQLEFDSAFYLEFLVKKDPKHFR